MDTRAQRRVFHGTYICIFMRKVSERERRVCEFMSVICEIARRRRYLMSPQWHLSQLVTL